MFHKKTSTIYEKATESNTYLTFPKFRVTLIFSQKRCAKIKLTIFAHDGCAKIKTREIRFFQGVHIFCLGTLLYNDTVVVTMFNQDFKPLCKTTQIVAILFHCFKFVSPYIFCTKLYFLSTAKIKIARNTFFSGCAKIKCAKIKPARNLGKVGYLKI